MSQGDRITASGGDCRGSFGYCRICDRQLVRQILNTIWPMKSPNPSEFLPPLSPFSAEFNTLDFRTDVSWSAYDLGVAMKSFDSIYSTVLLARHLAVMENERLRRSAEERSRYWELLESEGPHFEMFFREWLRFARRYGAGSTALFPFGPSSPGSFAEPVSLRLTTSEMDYYVSNPSEYIPATHELRIDKIEIASPGGFSLKGLGEAIHQIRELIKDLWYRNNQERKRGELEILKRKLDIAAKSSLHPQQVQVLAVSVVREVQDVGRLIQNGQLLLADEERPLRKAVKAVLPRRLKTKPPDVESST